MPRVLHLIDSLAPGGAERVAVLLANQGADTWLCATRTEGLLGEHLAAPSRFVLLNKKHTLDVAAWWRLRQLVKNQHIDLIHAHSTSVFWALSMKWATGCKVIWHDHYGWSEQLQTRPFRWLRTAMPSVDHVISVNEKLRQWALTTLKIPPEKVTCLPHFAALPERKMAPSEPPGIVCVANFRPQKDHYTLLEALYLVSKQIPLSVGQVMLIGAAVDADYAPTVPQKLKALGLDAVVHCVGAQSDVSPWLYRASIGVLSSRSEGLPVALLEYGLAGLAVVCTDVGDCRHVLDDGRCGMLVPPGDATAMAQALVRLLREANLRKSMGKQLQAHVGTAYDQTALMTRFQHIYQQLTP